MAKPTRFRDKWRIRWIDAAGKRQSDVLHDYKAAAHALRCREVEAEEIRRGLRSPEPEDRTFGELCDYWIEKRASRKRSGKDDKSIIERHLRPAFGPMKLRAIGVEEVDDFVLSKDHLEEKTIANHVTLLISMMRLATTFKMPWLLVVPKYNKPKTTLFSTDYSYLRTEEEIRRFLTAAREEGEHVLVLYATAIFTGLRAGELAALEWDDVDFGQRRITVQRSFMTLTKSSRVRYVPILDALLALLREWRLRNPGRLVFTNRDGNMLGPSGRVFQEVLHRVLDGARFPEVERNGKLRRYLVFHSLRHTFASHWVMRGGDIFKLQRILGHQSIAMTQRYAHLAPGAFAGDYDRLGPGLVAGGGEVIELRAATH